MDEHVRRLIDKYYGQIFMLNTRNKQGRRTTITDLHSVYGLFESFILTKSGSLIGGLELSGRESD